MPASTRSERACGTSCFASERICRCTVVCAGSTRAAKSSRSAVSERTFSGRGSPSASGAEVPSSASRTRTVVSAISRTEDSRLTRWFAFDEAKT